MIAKHFYWRLTVFASRKQVHSTGNAPQSLLPGTPPYITATITVHSPAQPHPLTFLCEEITTSRSGGLTPTGLFSPVRLFEWWMQSSLLLDVSNSQALSLSRGKAHSVANRKLSAQLNPVEKVITLARSDCTRSVSQRCAARFAHCIPTRVFGDSVM